MSDVSTGQDVAVQRERVSQLCEAFLRINESLDFDSVLQEVLDSARSLTGAQFGVIVLVTGQQKTAEFLFSGMTPEQAGELEQLPNKWELFEHLYGIEEPLRLQDFQGHLKEHGLSEFRSPLAIAPATAYLVAPIRHQDQRVGAIFMAEKEGGFSAEDQEILVLFASQAALVISNARQFRQEQRARADLETLINTAPMSVLVFDVKTKEMRSINREALRLIGDQGLTSESLYELLSTGTYRFSDGRVISQHGVCIGEAMISGETIRSNDKSTISLGAQVQDIHVAVSVADNGQGISADQMPHLFTKFSQSDDPDQSSDLGLGLAICKGVVEAHGGRIWAESDGPGLGSRFTFTIPVSDESTPHVAPQRTKAAARPQRTVSSELTRILAVDDDPRTLKHVRDSLTKEGYEPVVTGDPDEVVSLFQETDTQVVLLDLMLPDKDGIDLMKDLLAIRDTPVIFVSGYDQDELITKAFEMGAVDYIVKPFSSTELAARVRAALRKKPEQPLSFELGDLAINFAERSVSVAGEMVELTPTEFRLLSELSAKAGTAMDHDLLLQKVWGPDQPGDARRMRTVVKNLRQKLGDDARNPRYIVTVPHVGYRMPKA
ncbi:MAG: response regulator [bacterium]|nr:response regulator [bacterium]